MAIPVIMRLGKPLALLSGLVAALVLSAAPRITAVVEMRIALPAFFNKQEGWAVNGPWLVRTVDGGSTWERVKINVGGAEMNGKLRGTYFVSARTAWVGFTQGDGLSDRLGLSQGFVSTRDGGATWRKESLPNVEWYFDSLAATDDPKGPVWLGGQISQSHDAPAEDMECPQRLRGVTWAPAIYFRPAPGARWEAQRVPVENGCPVSMIHFLDERRGVAIAGSAIVFSEDGGRHWQQSDVRSSEKTLRAVNLQFRGREGWLGCDRGEILHTVDGGRHWDEIVMPGAVWSKAHSFGVWGTVYFADAATGFTLSGEGQLFETNDGGKTWNNVAVPERIVNFSCAEDRCWLVSEERLYRLDSL